LPPRAISCIDAGKFVAHDLAIEGVGAVAFKATEGVAAITLYLGIVSIIDSIKGGVILQPLLMLQL
jgi:hypothetical protein